uniref:Putative transposase n=1 Tax=uncultured bacterium fosmid pJB28H11 TaxID=1478062 RepID=A0A0H3UAE1_9BACT|nr:putative transposase [uncultured bacterium fosmid pJB28H11]
MHFGKSMNLSRIKAMCLMICALCKVQRVAYTRLASAFDTEAMTGSCVRRIQRLIAECVIDTDLIAKLILKLIPVEGPYNLAMDRTNWKYSSTNINILTLGIIYDGMAFPILCTMMNKRGNSNTEERIAIVDRFKRIAGPDSICHLMADREFVGDEWLGYLNACGIHYHIRIRENFHVIRHGRDSKAFWLFNDVKLGESKHLDGIYYVNGQACYLSGSKIKDKDGKPELQILVSYCNAKEALEMYKLRWQVETLFKGLKSSGFNIEGSHVRNLERMSNLFAIIMVAYIWCYLVGIYIHENIKQITVLKHGRRAVSLFKYGLDYISQCLVNHTDRYRIDVFKFLSYT